MAVKVKSKSKSQTVAQPKEKTKSGGKSDFYSRQREKLAKDKSSFRGGSDFWKPDSGKSVIRIVKFQHNGEEEWYVKDMRHWGVPEEKASLPCIGDDCPICEIEDEVSQYVWKGKFGESQGIAPQGKILVNVILRGRGGEDDRLVVANLPPSVVFGSKSGNGISTYMDPDAPEFCDPLSDDEGRDFIIEKSGEGMKTRYKVGPSPKASEIGMEVEGIDLYSLIPVASNEDYEAGIEAIREMTDERGRKGKRKPKDEDDDAEDE